MRTGFVTFFALLILAGCQNEEKQEKGQSAAVKDTATLTEIRWIDSVKNIGSVEAGKKVTIHFRFENTGLKPLFIVSAEPGCGCTVADYPKGAIAPGAEGLITAAYDAPKGTGGEFRKNIHVTTNTKGTMEHYIYFYGVIKNENDTTVTKKIDTAELRAVVSKELKRNLTLKQN